MHEDPIIHTAPDARTAYRAIADALGDGPDLHPVPLTDPRHIALADILGDDGTITRRTIAQEGRWAYIATARDGRAAWLLAGPGWGAAMTTIQVAAELGLTPGRVRQLARERGVGIHHGRDWMFSAADVAALRERAPGRPRKVLP